MDPNFKSLDVVINLDNNVMGFDGPVSDCDVCALGSNHQLVRPKAPITTSNSLFRLVSADLMGALTPETLRGYNCVTIKISDEHFKWTDNLPTR